MQEELRELVGGRELPPGTVLETSRGNLGRIYHAAIHDPSQRLACASSEPDILAAIEACLREILRLAAGEQGVRSVAIPLLGAGVFGLPPAFSGATVARAVTRFALAGKPARPLKVILVVRPDRAGQQGLAAAVQVLLDEGSLPPSWAPLRLGVPLLDPLEQEISRARDPRWRMLLLCRYAEVFTHYAHAILATGVPDRCQGRLASFSQPVSFGTVADWLRNLARDTVSASVPPLLRELAAHCLQRDPSLRELVHVRNQLVHGRSVPSTGTVETLLRTYVDADRWKALPSPLPTTDLDPWVRTLPAPPQGTATMALLERLAVSASSRLCYLDPCTGVTCWIPHQAP